MNRESDVLWLSVSAHLKCLDQRLLSQLVKAAPVRRWEYCQTIDEPCCIDDVVETLHDYISERAALEERAGQRDYKLHLVGHGVSGAVGLLYARRYPQWVASLTLLSVGALPAVNWQAHYYALRQLLPCSREIILAQMTRLLFGHQPLRFSKALSQLLAHDLDSNLTFHSLAHYTRIEPGGTEVPMLICNGEIDGITGAQPDFDPWKAWLKPEDRLWLCPAGNHFFHFYHSAVVANRMMDYWQQVSCHRNSSSVARPADANNKLQHKLLFVQD